MQDAVQEIKNKLAIEDVVASYVQLKKAGRYLKSCCPFHQEKTASFYVSPDKQIAYCFGCNKGGDLFKFIQDIEGMDFKDALAFLADKANVDLKKYDYSFKVSVSKDEKERLKNINEDASNYFVQQLGQTEAGRKVFEYLKNRGLRDESINEFMIGFAPDSYDILFRHLLEKGHLKKDIIESSLCISRDATSEKVLDRFRLRLMFPIHNDRGDLVAFGGRALKKGDEPKYLNSAEYILYYKGSILFNYDKSKKCVKENDLAIVVEGYFDAIMSYQAGVKNVVATSGTAVTEEQIKLLKRQTHNIAFAFDSDSAGQAALERAIKISQKFDLNLFVITIPFGKDCADTVKEQPQLWIEAVQAKQAYLEFFFKKYQAVYDLNTSQGKKDFSDSFLHILNGVNHPVEKDHYVKELSKLVGIPSDMIYEMMKKLKNVAVSRRKMGSQIESNTIVKNKKERLMEYFFGMILAFPEQYFKVYERIKSLEEFQSSLKKLGLVKQFGEIDQKSVDLFYESLNKISVYKEIVDHYNNAALLANLDDLELKKLAFEAEIKNEDISLVPEEFEKILALLYLDLKT